MKPVAAGNKIALDFMGLSVLAIPDKRPVAVEFVDRHGLGFIDDLRAGSGQRAVQILCHLGLAINHHGLAAGQIDEIDRMPLAVEAQLHAAMNEALGMHSRADFCFVEQVHRALFEHAGANSALDIVPALPLDDDRFDALQGKQSGQ